MTSIRVEFFIFVALFDDDAVDVEDDELFGVNFGALVNFRD